MLADFNNSFDIRTRNYFCCNLIAVTYYLPVCYLMTSVLRHRARETLQLLRRDTPDSISPDLWPPNSPDLNPVDYEIWAVMQRHVYKMKIHTIDELKQRLIEVWCDLEQSTVDMAIERWRGRLRACVLAKEGTSNIAFEITDCVSILSTIYHFCVIVLCFV